MSRVCFLLSLVLAFGVSAGEIFVPNADFEEIYKPGSTTITGELPFGDWTQGVGPECPIHHGEYTFSDGSTGTVADIPGWVGYDCEGWQALGGTYDRDINNCNLQGSISNEGRGFEGLCFLANGGGWGNQAGGLIVSAAPVAYVEKDLTYTLSVLAKGNAEPIVLELLAGDTILTPTDAEDPILSSEFQEFSRTYEAEDLVDYIGQPLRILLGVGRNATGNQSQFDNVSLRYTGIVHCPFELSASGGPNGVTLQWQNGEDLPSSVTIKRNGEVIESAAPADPPTYTDKKALPGLLEYELSFAMGDGACPPLTTTYNACITGLSSARGEIGIDLAWTNNMGYAGIRITRNGEVLEEALPGSAEAYTDDTALPGFLTYTVSPIDGSCDPATVNYDACITDLTVTISEAGPVLSWKNNMLYEGIKITRSINGGPPQTLVKDLDGDLETYTDEDISDVGLVVYSVAPTTGTCDPASVETSFCGCIEPGCIEIAVPNSDFEELYLPGDDTITGTISDGGWTQGVGPECPIDNGEYLFSDGSTGVVADIPGWVGYDCEGWQGLGGTYNRDINNCNLQGSIGNQGQGVEGLYYLANGGDWGNPAGGLIVSDAPVATVEAGFSYRLSVTARGAAEPVVLELLAGETVLTPTSSVDPVLSGNLQNFCRTYDSSSLVDYIGEPLRIVLGVGRNATGTQTRFDNVRLWKIETGEPEEKFNRGDVNADGSINIADAISLLGHLFGGEAEPSCPDAADGNDDGGLDIADAIAILGHLFGGAGDLPQPFGSCGVDPTEDLLGPCVYPAELCPN